MTSKVGRRARGVVLVVDDDQDVRAALEEVLREAGYDVLGAVDGTTALDLLRTAETGRWKCDVVLLDLQMPRMNGREFCAEREADPALTRIPVLLMSGDRRIAKLSEELNASGYASKPFDLADLLRKVARLCWQE